jgi:hypothetical protein
MVAILADDALKTTKVQPRKPYQRRQKKDEKKLGVPI